MQKETVNVVQPKVAQISPAIYLQNDNNVVQSNNRFDWKELRRTGLHKYPELQKILIQKGMLAKNIFSHAPDAYAFLKLSLSNLQEPKLYIDKNGVVVESISQIPFDFKDTVQIKVKEKMQVEDCKGFISRPDSSLSQEIMQSYEYQDFIKTHIKELLSGRKSAGSVIFKSNQNLLLTIKKADILDTYINKNGDIVSFVLDTYDFNADDPDWKVEWARNVQEKGLLSKFFSLTIIVTPREEWLQWFI